MARAKVDKETRRAILDARSMIVAAEKSDCNEAETRRRIERMFETLMGYDPFTHLSRERAVRGAGETEHVDFAIELGEGEEKHPVVMVEIKRVTVDLARKHLKQVSSYAINAGCEWILLTNGKEWGLHHVSFGQPPITKHIVTWDLVTDDVAVLADRFNLISLKSIRKGALDKLWQTTKVLSPRSMLEAILSVDGIKTIRRTLKRDSGVAVSPEDLLAGIRRLLNEPALKELEDIQIVLPQRKRRTSKKSGEVVGAPEEISSNAQDGPSQGATPPEMTAPQEQTGEATSELQ